MLLSAARRLVPDNVPPLVRASATTVTLAATYLGQTARATVGNKQYTIPSPLTLNFATNGAGGLDTGAMATNARYHIYLVVSGGALALIASLALPTTGPAGFLTSNNANLWIGKVNTSAITASHIPESCIVNTYIGGQRALYCHAKFSSAFNTSGGSTSQLGETNGVHVAMRIGGAMMRGTGRLTASSPGGGGASVSLGDNLSLDQGAYTLGAGSTDRRVGIYSRLTGGSPSVWSNTNSGILFYPQSTGGNLLSFGNTNGSGASVFTHPPANTLFGSGDPIEYNFEAIIREWSGLFTLEF